METDSTWTEEFGTAIVALASAFGLSLNAVRIRLYASALSDLPIDKVKMAMARAVRECKFFPSSAELRTLVDSTQDDAAVLAWAGLHEAASAVGAYGAVELDTWTAQAVEDVFGCWAEFCTYSDGPAMAVKRQEFVAAYRRARRDQPEGTRTLLGLCERSTVYRLASGRAIRVLESR